MRPTVVDEVVDPKSYISSHKLRLFMLSCAFLSEASRLPGYVLEAQLINVELRLSLIDRRILLARLIPHSFRLIRLAVFSLVTQCFLYTVADLIYIIRALALFWLCIFFYFILLLYAYLEEKKDKEIHCFSDHITVSFIWQSQ